MADPSPGSPVRNVLILGSGRSGTSMVAGTLAGAGWFVGARPYAPRSSNPKGFFESPDVNGVNELILSEVVPASERMGAWQRWLAWLPEDVQCRTSPRVERILAHLVAQSPWCFKDPRLSYTLPVWRPHIGTAGLICVFRDPAVTARSIAKECAQEDYLASLAMTEERALAAWTSMYRRILDQHRHEGDWLFLHYEQLLGPEGQRRLEDFVGAPISRAFPEESLRRTQSEEPLPEDAARAYEQLCELAGHATERRARRAPLAPRHAESRTAYRLALERFCSERPAPRASLRGAKDLAELEALARASAGAVADVPADRASVDGRLPSMALWERTLRDLGGQDLGALEATGQQAAAEALVGAVLAALRELVDVWQREERIARHERETAGVPWPIASRAARRVLAWPCWTVEALANFLRAPVAPMLGPDAPVLCLRHDPQHDGELETALAALESAYGAVFPDAPELEVVLMGEAIAREDLARVGLAVDAAFEPLDDASNVRRAWLVGTGARLVRATSELARPAPFRSA